MIEEKKFQSRTPEGIMNYSTKEVVALVKDTRTVGASPTSRAILVQMLYDVLGYDLTNDILLMLISEPTAKLGLATAGGGKTTAANIQIVLEKIFFKNPDGEKLKGSRCLCLMYNKHNVEPFEKKHAQMVAKISAAGVKNFDVDSEVRATTLHSYANMWCNEYRVEADLIGCKFIQEYEAIDIMKMAIKTMSKKHLALLDLSVDSGAESLHTLYSYKAETLSSYEDLKETDKFIDSKLPLEAVQDIFELFDKVKKRKHVYEYVDMLTKFYQILQNDKIRDNIQSYYDYVVADEVQDFTPLMFETLKLLVSDKTPLMCIGDEDQSIYGFRGANIYNALSFTEMFEDAACYSLTYNRRCGEVIVNSAKKVIEQNKLRFSKEILPVREGGKIQLIPYNSLEGQVLNVVSKLKKYDKDELHSTVICTRDKASTMLISQELADNNIPCYVTKGFHPYSHEIYRHIMDVLRILARPMDNYAQLNLYKALPIKRDELYKVLKYDPYKQDFAADAERKHFARIDYGAFLTRKNFKEALDELVELSALIKEKPMNTFFDRVMKLINRWFWITKKNYNDDAQLDEIFEKKATNLFNVPHTFEYVNQEILRNKEKYRKNDTFHRGVNISTFHSLKGLEFKNVFMLFLDNDVFPNFPLIDSRPYTKQLKQSLKESETRLCYVAMTRAKDNLYMYYSEANPSYYVRLLNEDLLEEEEIGDASSLVANDTISIGDLEMFTEFAPKVVQPAVVQEQEDDDFLMLEEIPQDSDDNLFSSLHPDVKDDIFTSLNKQTNMCDSIIQSVSKDSGDESLADMFTRMEEVPIATNNIEAKGVPKSGVMFKKGNFLDKVSSRFGGVV